MEKAEDFELMLRMKGDMMETSRDESLYSLTYISYQLDHLTREMGFKPHKAPKGSSGPYFTKRGHGPHSKKRRLPTDFEIVEFEDS